MQKEPHRKTKNTAFSKRLTSCAVIFVITAGVFLAYSETVSASWQSGLFSSVINWLNPDQASASITNSNGSGSQITKENDENRPTNVLIAAANIDPNPYSLADIAPVNGDVLVPDIAATNSASSSDSVNTQVSTYVVQSDDTLSSLALMFDISTDTIKQANHLSGNTIKPGQSLIILPVSGVLYTVVANDSLTKISKKYSINADDIMTYNGMTAASSTLAVGQQLIIPHGKPSASETSSFITIQSQKFKVPSFEPLLDAVWNWPSYPGYFACPVPGARLSQGLHGHNAVDLAIAKGTPILAAASGIVTISKNNGYYGRSSNGGYGNFVMISHPNGAETLYAHMLKTAVSVGEHVSQGEVIGYIGMTGMTTGPHTHFEIRNAQNPFVDPSLCR
jgi:murein DD-endopeptidase MepM/ murein hydrolase activator NlpD